jgi:hypothetical protein
MNKRTAATSSLSFNLVVTSATALAKNNMGNRGISYGFVLLRNLFVISVHSESHQVKTVLFIICLVIIVVCIYLVNIGTLPLYYILKQKEYLFLMGEHTYYLYM